MQQHIRLAEPGVRVRSLGVQVERHPARIPGVHRAIGRATSSAGNDVGNNLVFLPLQVSGVAVDSAGRVYVFHRAGASFDNDTVIAAPTVMVIDGESGALLSEWGAGRFVTPHGISIDANDHVWLTDTSLDQVVEATTQGEVLHVYDGR